MATPKKSRPKKVTRKTLKDMLPTEVASLKKKDAVHLVREARKIYESQVKKFEKYKGKTYSHAVAKMEEYYDTHAKKPVSSMRKNDLITELFRLKDFVESKSSTVPGARKIARETDIRLYGIDEETGKPAFRMSYQQSVDFWSIYDEFKSMEREDEWARLGSDRIQQMLAERAQAHFTNRDTKNSDFKFGAGDFTQFRQDLLAQQEREVWHGSIKGITNSVLSRKRSSK